MIPKQSDRCGALATPRAFGEERSQDAQSLPVAAWPVRVTAQLALVQARVYAYARLRPAPARRRRARSPTSHTTVPLASSTQTTSHASANQRPPAKPKARTMTCQGYLGD